MKKNLLICLSTLMVLLHGGVRTSADTRVRGKYTSMGQTSESVVYTKSLRQRFEYGADMAVIEQSDLERMIQLNPQTQTYLVLPLVKGSSTAAAPPASVSSDIPQTAGGGTITQTSTRVDTGERRETFGYTARHARQEGSHVSNGRRNGSAFDARWEVRDQARLQVICSGAELSQARFLRREQDR